MIPFYLSGTAGRLFCIYHEASRNGTRLGDLIFVPPFAEELNKSRHTVAKMARELARRGWGVLVLDLYGTGDSEGSFDECRWEIWREDVLTACTWLRDRGSDGVGLWGLRLGALLAVDVVVKRPELFTRLLFWQPVLNGKQFLTQQLRLRAASAMTDPGGPPMSIAELRRQLAAGESVRIAGYPVAPALARAFEKLDLIRHYPSPGPPVLWVDVVPEEPAQPSRATLDVLGAWKARGVNAEQVTVVDRPFWSLQSLEPIWADQLIASTLKAL